MNYFFIFIFLFVAELVYFKLADYFNIIDKPNERSSHSRVTLRGGGIIFYIGVLLYFILNNFQYPWFFTGLTLITGISFADDIRPQSSKIRLVIHFVAMAFMFYQWNLFSLSWYFTIFALIFCTGILNAYNFMDGINGITGGYSLLVAGALLYINVYQVSFVDNDFLYILLIALFVFSFFNFRTKAKCFAGDVGSVSIAFILVFLLGLLVIRTGDFSYLVLLSVYGVDTVLTITHRLILKENILQPHRKHVYQLMANELKIPHVFVSLIYILLQAMVIVGLFIFKLHSYYYLFVVIILLSFVYTLFKKRFFYLHNL